MTRKSLNIRPIADCETESCEKILRSLPEWFGIESSIISYRQDIESMDTYGAFINGRLAGFITLTYHNALSAEIQVMAVQRSYHRKGVGGAMVGFVENKARRTRKRFLQVKTLGPSHPDKNYKRTRAFYLDQGFVPLEENHLWGSDIPCLIMIKALNEFCPAGQSIGRSI